MEPGTNQYRPPPEFIRSDRAAIRKGTVASGFWSIGFQATTTAARSAEKVAHLENGRARKAIHSMPRRFCGCPWTSATVHRMSYATQLRDRPSSTTGTSCSRGPSASRSTQQRTSGQSARPQPQLPLLGNYSICGRTGTRVGEVRNPNPHVASANTKVRMPRRRRQLSQHFRFQISIGR